MSRPRVLFMLAIGLVLAVHPMLASTVAVGTCKPSLTSFTTISAAVVAVPSGSTVQVCPGTYPEQVAIAQSLTLKGISSGNAGQAVITVPGSGLTTVTSGDGYTIAAQVDVTAGTVNISDITVDATGSGLSYPTWVVGILYDSGSSGTVNEITARGQNGGGGVGVWADNVSATNESVAITNSSFHDIDDTAVVTDGSTLLATVKGNTMQAGYYQVQWASSGSLTANVINGGYEGVTAEGGAFTVSGNTLANQSYGIVGSNGVTATSNKISNASVAGIYDFGGGDTYKVNTITKTSVGIEFNCQSPTVTGNTINDATTGLNDVPASFSGANSFDNVVTLRTDGCGSAPTSPKAPHSGPRPAPAH
jgi:hypothetical protein